MSAENAATTGVATGSGSESHADRDDILLSIRNMCVSYADGGFAVEDFNLEMPHGSIVCIVGESGCGKTTIIRTLIGSLVGDGRVTSGEVELEGEPLLDLNEQQWCEIRGTKISTIFQDSGAMMNPVRKIGSQYVEYIRAHRDISKKEAWDIAVEMLTKMRLPDADNVMKSYPFQLSGGMRQRVGISMAMTFQPLLLLADEPTSSLDVTTQAQIVREMMELRDNYDTSIIMVTHNLGVAAYMADELIVIRSGHVVDRGTRVDILEGPVSDYTRILLDSVSTLGGDRIE